MAISGQFAYAQATDTTAADSTEHKVKKKDIAGHQLCIGFDVLRPVLNDVTHGGIGYGFEADYYMRNEFYLAAEGGWGSSNVNYDNLKYSTTNNFLSFCFNFLRFFCFFIKSNLFLAIFFFSFVFNLFRLLNKF